MPKSMKKTWRFRDLRFRVFYRKPNVKIVFLHEDGCRKSMKNRSKIDAKTGFRKREPRGPKSERKWSPKWSQKRIFYVKKRKKGPRGAKSVDLEYFRFSARTENGRKKACQKWCRNLMPKKIDFGRQFDLPDGRRGVRGQRIHALFSLITPWHRPVSADFGTRGKSKIAPKSDFRV